jgi:hypothetical protein
VAGLDLPKSLELGSWLGLPVAMRWDLWLGVVGIVATIVFGYWAVLLTRSKKYPGHLTYYRDTPIRLFADITANLPQITVQYKGHPAGKTMSLLRGYLVNTGAKDITPDMVAEPVQFGLGEGYTWLEATGKASFDEAEHVKIKDAKVVELSLGLFRQNDFIKFEGLIEFAEGKNWGGQMWTDHRIADTANIRWDLLRQKPRSKRWFMYYEALPIGVGAFYTVAALVKKPINITSALMWSPVLLGMVLLTITEQRTRRRARQIRALLKLEEAPPQTAKPQQ